MEKSPTANYFATMKRCKHFVFLHLLVLHVWCDYK